MAKIKAFPSTLGACIDQAYKLREERLKAQKEVDQLKEVETKLKDHILASFSQTTLDGARGKLATASVSKLVVAQVKDWEALQKYIKRTGEFDLLKRSVNDGAYRERLNAKKVVPGVEPFTVTKLSLTKSTKG